MAQLKLGISCCVLEQPGVFPSSFVFFGCFFCFWVFDLVLVLEESYRCRDREV